MCALGYAFDSRISIHAPLTGSDISSYLLLMSRPDFNPRSPYGERPIKRPIPMAPGNFNPRSPYGERLYVIS